MLYLLTGWQAGIKSNDSSKNAIIEGIEPSRIYNELNKGKIVIMQDFKLLMKTMIFQHLEGVGLIQQQLQLRRL